MSDGQHTETQVQALLQDVASAPDQKARLTDLARENLARLRQGAEDALPRARVAIEAARRLGAWKNMGRLAIDTAEALMSAGRFDESREFVECIRTAAEAPGPDSAQIMGCFWYTSSEADYLRGRHARAREKLLEARRHWQAARFLMGEQAVLNQLASIAGLLGDLEEALECYQRSLTIAGELDDAQLKVSVTYNIGWTLEQMGRWEDAAACFYRVIDDQCVRARPELAGQAYNCLGELLYRRNKLDKAIECFRAACDLQEKLPAHSAAYGDALVNLGQTCFRQGNLQAAADAYAGAANWCDRFADDKTRATLCVRLAELELARSDTAAASQSCDRALKLARQTEMQQTEAEALRIQGLLAAAKGDVQTATALFEQVIALLANAEESYELARVRLDYGRMLLRLGRNEEAMRLLQQAARSFRRLSVLKEELEINRLLFESRLAANRGEALLASLTELAAMGLELDLFLEQALSRVCETLGFSGAALVVGDRAVHVRGHSDMVGALALARGAERTNTPTELNWPIGHDSVPTGRLYLVREAAGPVEGDPLVLDAVSALLLDRLRQSGLTPAPGTGQL